MSRSAINRIREFRKLAGLSQRDLADRVNDAARHQQLRTTAASSDTVSRWERGQYTPQPIYQRLLAEVLGVAVDALQLGEPAKPTYDDMEEFVEESLDPRVEHSRKEWQATRRALNAQRYSLAQVAAHLYPIEHRLGATGLITSPGWLPTTPVDLSAIHLDHLSSAPAPTLDGSEPEASYARPRQTLVRRYSRYTQAIRDLAKPRLFENRLCWRLAALDWSTDKGEMAFADTTYFAACDVFETTAHELAYVALDADGTPSGRPTMRDLPYRRLISNPFDLARRPVMPAISTLTIRAGRAGADFLLHRRDPRAVAAAGGMLQVIPSGIFQPSSVLPAAQQGDFDLWRNFMREFSEELLGNPEHDGDGQPVQYEQEPFATLDRARQDGRIRIYCLGVALDALTLVGEVLTVAVVDAALFDEMGRDFVDRNDEGSVVAERVPFTADAIDNLLAGERLAPAGAGCVTLAWQHRDSIFNGQYQD